MKRIISLTSAISITMLTLSCEKEITPEVNPAEETVLTECTFTASIEDSKLTLSGLKSSWDNGDEIAVCQYGRWKHGDNTRDNTRNKFTASGDGAKVSFLGTIANYHAIDTSEDAEEDNAVANQISFTYPYSAVIAYNSGSSIANLSVPSTQTGKISDFGKYAHYNDSFSESKTNTSFDGEKLTFKTSVTLKSITPVIKFNVPASLNATKIEIYGSDAKGAAKGIAGTYKMRLTGSTKNFESATESKITISDNGNVISGEKYVVLAPTSMPGTTRVLQNDAEILTFKIYSGETLIGRFEGKIKGNKPTNGYIKDLGTLPSPFKQIILDVVPDSSFPRGSSNAKNTKIDFYSEGYMFSVLANKNDDGTNFTQWYYSSDKFTMTVSGNKNELPFGPYSIMKLPTISGYNLSKVIFSTTLSDKNSYIWSDYKNKTALASFHIPDHGTNYESFTIENIKESTNYYFGIKPVSSVNFGNLKLYYTKKPE